MTTQERTAGFQKKFDFSPPRPRPFLANLPAKIDTYEEGVARLFQWKTDLNYYATVDQIVDFVINTKRLKVFDFQTDTGTFALKLAGRKAFNGKIYSFDSNITLLERARQRARHLNLEKVVDFRQFEGGRWPVPDGFADIAVTIFDFHRQTAAEFLQETARILSPEGHLLVAEVLEPRSYSNLLIRYWKKWHLKYFQKNSSEALGVYYDREEMIRMLFDAGFRQVIIQGLREPTSMNQGVFSLIAATK